MKREDDNKRKRSDKKTERHISLTESQQNETTSANLKIGVAFISQSGRFTLMRNHLERAAVSVEHSCRIRWPSTAVRWQRVEKWDRRRMWGRRQWLTLRETLTRDHRNHTRQIALPRMSRRGHIKAKRERENYRERGRQSEEWNVKLELGGATESETQSEREKRTDRQVTD